jgi:GH18 family chitinase
MEGPGTISDPGYYKPSFAPYDNIIYAFLTLSERPNPDIPPPGQWNGQAIYETMTLAPILTVMNDQSYTYNWQSSKIKAMLQACKQESKKFLWGVGGWSDLEQTIAPGQIDTFVNMSVDLLKQYGDGIDFDWEHLSQLSGGDRNPHADEQLATLAETMLRLRQALDKAGLKDKVIGYTTRFNSFMKNSKDVGFSGFNSDGEGLAINTYLKGKGTSLEAVASFINIMAYDVPPNQMPDGKSWTPALYDQIIHSFGTVDGSWMVMGF